MSIKKYKKIKIVFGKINFLRDVNKIFNDDIIHFFNEISHAIINNKINSNHPDLMTFAFWCRKANLIKISEEPSIISRFSSPVPPMIPILTMMFMFRIKTSNGSFVSLTNASRRD